jgi:ferric-dicitrate binding protein FerR (iron transport regulator)
VAGTRFNVSAYGDSRHVAVVLVSGKVDVDTWDTFCQTLAPNEMFSWEDGKMETRTVNVNNYISWIDGNYTFDNEKFPVVLQRLARYYGTGFSWSAEVEALYCSGTLNLKDDIHRLLEGLETAVPVRFVRKEAFIDVTVKP